MTTDTPRTDAETYIWQDGGENPFVHRDFARQLERELATAQNDAFNLTNALSKAEAEVERLKKKFKRAIEIADEFWGNQKQAVLVYHQDLADELDQLKATLNPAKK